MTYVRTVSDEQADGLLLRIYQAAVKRAGKVFNILRIQSLNPPVLEASLALYQATMRAPSPVPRALREMIAVVVSRANHCHY